MTHTNGGRTPERDRARDGFVITCPYGCGWVLTMNAMHQHVRAEHAPPYATRKALREKTLAMTREKTLALDINCPDGSVITFQTCDAEWNGETWNGFPAPRLPKWQGYLLSLLMGETDVQPRADIDEDATHEAAYVHMDGLTWYEADSAS